MHRITKLEQVSVSSEQQCSKLNNHKHIDLIPPSCTYILLSEQSWISYLTSPIHTYICHTIHIWISFCTLAYHHHHPPITAKKTTTKIPRTTSQRRDSQDNRDHHHHHQHRQQPGVTRKELASGSSIDRATLQRRRLRTPVWARSLSYHIDIVTHNHFHFFLSALLLLLLHYPF